MKNFSSLFGVAPHDVREDVILTPFLNVEHFKKKETQTQKGLLFQTLTGEHYTVIRTGIGASFIGDAILFLKDTACKRVYFLGSCGAVTAVPIASIVIAEKAYAFESFSQILGEDFTHTVYNADTNLQQDFIRSTGAGDIATVSVATFASLSLERRQIALFKKHAIDVVDMEVSAFLAAAHHFSYGALPVLYVSDSIHDECLLQVTDDNRKAIRQTRRRAISLLCDYIDTRSA